MTELERYVELINDRLLEYLPEKDVPQKSVIEAMEYSLIAGGKRIRPVLTLAFCELCGGDAQAALPFACAVELVHTYSLIHDDLPCMDNDTMRRGRPANHVANGEAMALLAGDALLTRAFEVMLSEEVVANVGAQVALEAARCLAKNIGTSGMIGGQVLDMEAENKRVDLSALTYMHSLKTSALMVAAAKMGCLVARAAKSQLEAAETYAKNVGLAFQIMDDVLDETATSEALGKTVGSDKASNKSTYVSLLGVERSLEAVIDLTTQAVSALKAFDGDTSFLENLAWSLASRGR